MVDTNLPILGNIGVGEKPFVFGLFAGNKKPKNVEEFLFDFIKEVKQLEEGFSIEGRNYHLVISHFLCDVPDRFFIKKNHKKRYRWERCDQEGEYLSGMVFPEMDVRPRCDADFNNLEDPSKGPTPISKVNVGLVTQFVLDYMHLVCLGFTRKLLMFWIKGDLTCRIGSQACQ